MFQIMHRSVIFPSSIILYCICITFSYWASQPTQKSYSNQDKLLCTQYCSIEVHESKQRQFMRPPFLPLSLRTWFGGSMWAAQMAFQLGRNSLLWGIRNQYQPPSFQRKTNDTSFTSLIIYEDIMPMFSGWNHPHHYSSKNNNVSFIVIYSSISDRLVCLTFDNRSHNQHRDALSSAVRDGFRVDDTYKFHLD